MHALGLHICPTSGCAIPLLYLRTQVRFSLTIVDRLLAHSLLGCAQCRRWLLTIFEVLHIYGVTLDCEQMYHKL